jgi:lipopolysaccharide biosynthesis protein
MGLIPSSFAAQRFAFWLEKESKPAIICPSDWLSNQKEWGRNNLYVFSLCRELGISMKNKAPFPKGTMFWMNNEMLEIFIKINIPSMQHKSEIDLLDSTWAHGLERIVGQVVVNGGRGFKIKSGNLDYKLEKRFLNLSK